MGAEPTTPSCKAMELPAWWDTQPDKGRPGQRLEWSECPETWFESMGSSHSLTGDQGVTLLRPGPRFF